jgi:molybdenum cofactor guanylyltransferase
VRRPAGQIQQGVDLLLVGHGESQLRREVRDPCGVEVVVAHGAIDSRASRRASQVHRGFTHDMAPPAHDSTAALVLAGGAARRFGSDKTRATLHGLTLLERAVGVAAPLVDDLVVIGPWAPLGRRHLSEAEPGIGPLGALAFGLQHVDADRTLVLAADHPQLQPLLLQLLLDELGDHDAVVPVAHGEPQPLVACYRSTVAARANGLLAAGERRLRALLHALDVRWLDQDEWGRHDRDGRSFLDVDRPEQLEAMRGSAPERQQLDAITRRDLERGGSEHHER